MTRILNPAYRDNYAPPDLCHDRALFSAAKKEDVWDYLDKNRSIFGIDFMGAQDGNLFFYRALKKFDVPYASLCVNSIPYPENAGFMKKLKNIRFGAGRKILNRLSLLLGAGLWIQLPALILAGGKRCPRQLLRPAKGTKVIWAHTLDYDLYLKQSRTEGSPQDVPYAVFLDEYFPFHPDFLLSNVSMVSLDAVKYYSGLNRLFEKVEKDMKMPVVVAAHPRSRYPELKEDFFRGRKVQKGATIGLVARSKVVLAHGSTAINFAVMHRKPVIFLTSDEIERSCYGPFISNFAEQFRKVPVNIDGDLSSDFSREYEVDEDAYLEYFTNYIKIPGTPEKPFWDILADHLQAL